MADLSELQSSLSVKIAGSDTSGAETGFVNQYNAQVQSADLINTAVVQSAVSVSTTAIEMKVGGSILANRKMLIIQAQNTGFSYGFSSGSQPFDLPNGTTLQFSIGPNISIWIKKSSGTGTISIAELS